MLPLFLPTLRFSDPFIHHVEYSTISVLGICLYGGFNRSGWFKDVHRRQKLMTDFFQTFRVDYFSCEYLNFEKKKCVYCGFLGVIF